MRIIREPLFHFLILVAAIFALYAVVTRHKTDKPGEIVVTQSSIENLVTGFNPHLATSSHAGRTSGPSARLHP